MPKERFDTAGEMLHYCWHLLFRATQERSHPMRTPVIGTCDPDTREPHLRTVILRQVFIQQRQIEFYTDARSAKVGQLRAHPHLSWLFWDDKKSIQVRARGVPMLHHRNEKAQAHWEQIGLEGRKNYAGAAPPGTPAEEATRGLPDFWRDDMPLEKSEYAFDNFLLIETEVLEMDCLLLHPAGHQRIQYVWDPGQKDWKGGWVVA